jgi:hypothetical protein
VTVGSPPRLRTCSCSHTQICDQSRCDIRMLPGFFENGQRVKCRSSEISGLIGVACGQRGWHVFPVPDVIDITLCGWQVLRNNSSTFLFCSLRIIAHVGARSSILHHFHLVRHHASAVFLLSAGLLPGYITKGNGSPCAKGVMT